MGNAGSRRLRAAQQLQDVFERPHQLGLHLIEANLHARLKPRKPIADAVPEGRESVFQSVDPTQYFATGGVNFRADSALIDLY